MNLQLLAPAKINFLLKVLQKSENDYHKIFSIIQTISLYDKIIISTIPENKIVIKCNIKKLSGKNNLCYKVAKLLKKKYKIKNGIKICITKNIPVGSGLGGASSDAAAVLKGLRKLFKLKIKDKQLLKLSAEFGKDIPFFIRGGCCIVESYGEKVTSVRNIPWKKTPLWFLLVYPNIVLSTKIVYTKYNEIVPFASQNKIDKNKIIDLLQHKKFTELLHNDLEQAAIKLYPKLREVKCILKRYSEYVSMTGSGSCFFAILKNKIQAENLKQIVKRKLKNCKMYVVKSCQPLK